MAHRPSTDELNDLSKFRDEAGHAVTFYFHPSPGPNARRDATAMEFRARDVFSDHFSPEQHNSGLLRDLDHCMQIVEETTGADSQLRIVFACHDRGIWKEFLVPFQGRMLQLEAGTNFDVAPLQALCREKSEAQEKADLQRPV